MMYRDGDTVPRDDAEAYKWFVLASAQGNKAATIERALLKPGMDRAQIESAEKAARGFTPVPENPKRSIVEP